MPVGRHSKHRRFIMQNERMGRFGLLAIVVFLILLYWFVSQVALAIFINYSIPLDLYEAFLCLLGAVVFLIFVDLSVNRFHDIGCSGRQALTLLIPICNIYPLILLFFKPGDPNRNEWGPPPKKARRITYSQMHKPADQQSNSAY